MFRIFRQPGSTYQRQAGSTTTRPPRFRPRLEPLEERCVPATFNVAAGDVAGLYAALNTANANGQEDTVNLAPGTPYTLTAPGNFVDTGLTLLADGGKLLTINGNGATIARAAAYGTPAFRLIEVTSGSAITLSGLTLS